MIITTLIGGAIALIIALILLWRALLVTSAPDEWLLRIRHGQLIDSGVGVIMLRRPGDIFARFSSTVQRVGFTLETLTADRLQVTMEGFILWSVAEKDDAPFQAFRSLGLANLLNAPKDLGHPKHLLTKPQYRAFQQIVAATAQRFASTLELNSLLRNQEAFVTGLSRRLSDDIEDRGVAINQVEILKIQPSDPEILAALCAGEDARIREEAAMIKLECNERITTKKREQATRESQEEASARRDRQAHEARIALEIERQKAKLIEEKQAIQLQELESEGQIRERERLLEHNEAILAEDRSRQLLEARHARQAIELDFTLMKTRSKAEAERDAKLAILTVDAQKPQEVRDNELAMLTAEKLAEAINIKDGRWVTIGDSPLASVGALLESFRSLTAPPHQKDAA
jgi:hypothetical protein